MSSQRKKTYLERSREQRRAKIVPTIVPNVVQPAPAANQPVPTANQPVPTANQPVPASSEVEEDSKKNQIRWRSDMDEVLISSLVDQVVSKGRKVDNAFKSEELQPLITQVRDKCDVVIAEKNIRSRLKTLRKEWVELHALFQVSGFGYDESNGRITADSSVWEEYSKDNPNIGKLRGKVCPYYPELEILFGNDTASGDRAISGHDIPQMSGSNVNDEISLDDNEVDDDDEMLPNPSVTSKSATKGGSTSRRKRANLTEETIAFSVLAESSKKIAAALQTYTSQKKVEWQTEVDKLKGVGISNLAHVFLGITDETFRRDWINNKLRRITSDVHL